MTRRGGRLLFLIAIVWFSIALLGEPFHLRLFGWCVALICMGVLYANGDSE